MQFHKMIAGIAAGLLCMTSAVLPVFAEETTQEEKKTYEDGMFTYAYVDGGVELSACDTTALSVTLPAETDGRKIVGIADGAFYSCANLQSVTLSDGLTYIGRYAFSGCESLQSVTIPDTVTEIGANTFSGCFALETLHLPAKLEEIPEGMCYTCAMLHDVNFPDTLKTIGDEAFYNCMSLTEIDLPDTLTSFGNYAFGFCSNLQNADIPRGVTALSGGTFAGCTSIPSVTIPKQLEDLGSLSFLGCTSLSAFEVEEGNLKYTAKDGVIYSIDETTLIAYPAGNDQPSFTIPEGVTIVHDAAFFHAEKLNTVEFPSTLQFVGAGAFDGCSTLKSVTLPEGTEILYETAFADCAALQHVSLPSTLKGVGNYAFYNDPKLMEITIPANCRTIGEYAFGYIEQSDDDGEKTPVKLEGFKQHGGGMSVIMIVGIVAGVAVLGVVVFLLIRVIRKNQKTTAEHDAEVIAHENYESIAGKPEDDADDTPET